jgi:8-oxo-dGTP pyrophosphatase MutT (NUDIX family)
MSMKLYQVVNANDSPQYSIRGKKSLHNITHLYHRSSHIFIEVFGGKFIIQKKAEGTENAGLWSSAVSGHVESSESYGAAALREAKEELGLTLSRGDLERVLKIDPQHHKETNREFVTLWTYLLDPSTEIININRKELDGIAIMPLPVLEKDIKNNRDRYSPVFVLLFDLFLSQKRSSLDG